jgi:hypothetical protein
MVLNSGSLGGYGGSEKELRKEQEINKNMMMTMKKSERGEEWWEWRRWNVKGGVLVSLLEGGEVFDCMGILTEAEGTNKVQGWKKKRWCDEKGTNEVHGWTKE